MERAVEHLGPERAGALPAQVLPPVIWTASAPARRDVQAALQATADVDAGAAVLAELRRLLAAAA